MKVFWLHFCPSVSCTDEITSSYHPNMNFSSQNDTPALCCFCCLIFHKQRCGCVCVGPENTSTTALLFSRLCHILSEHQKCINLRMLLSGNKQLKKHCLAPPRSPPISHGTCSQLAHYSMLGPFQPHPTSTILRKC